MLPIFFSSWANELTLASERNGRKTLTTVQGLPKKFDQKKILKVIKKKFGTSPTATLILVVHAMPG